MYPHRHVNLEKAQKKAKRFKLFVRGNPVPSDEQWSRIGLGLNQSDTLADELAEWMRSHTMKAAWPLIQKATASGFDSLSESEQQHTALRNFFTHVETEPEWLDRDKIKTAQQQIARAHPAGYYVMRNAGLMAGYLSSDLNKPLVMTGALSNGAGRRVAQTMKWYSDCVDLGGLDRFGPGYRSSVHVRILHAVTRRNIMNRDDWDLEDMGLPINQTDTAATWLAFSVIYLLGIRTMGVPVSDEEAECVMHLFHYACWLLGLDDDWFTDDEHEGRALLLRIMSTYRTADESSYLLGQALMGEIPNIPYTKLKPVTWRIEQFKHLSTTRLFVGRKGMKQLGLPTWVPPLYPLACIPINTVKHRVLAKIPALRSKYQISGQQERDALVKLHFAGASPHLAAAKIDQTNAKR